MRRNLVLIWVVLFAAGSLAATHVLWYNAQTKGYGLQDNPGPNLPAGITVHEGMIASGNSNSGNFFSIGHHAIWDSVEGGEPDPRSAFIWSYDLGSITSGAVTSAKVRAEFRDGWCTGPMGVAGNIDMRVGVVDFAGNITTWGGVDQITGDAIWVDFDMAFNYAMGARADTSGLYAEEAKQFTALAGKPDTAGSPATVLDKLFWEIDVTNQINWIIQHQGGQYAIVFLCTKPVDAKMNCYSFEDSTAVDGNCDSDAPWTTDGNTMHLVLEENPTSPLVFSIAAVQPQALHAMSSSGLRLSPKAVGNEMRFGLDLGAAGTFELSVHDLLGREVWHYVGRARASGSRNIRWNAGKANSGLHIVTLRRGSETAARRFLIMK